MSQIVEFVVRAEVPDFPPDEWLIESDGVPLETEWHGIEIGLLRELVYQHLTGRDDFFAGGNMFIYFNETQARNKDYRGPDFFFVWGAAPKPLRPFWAVWKEDGRYPNVIVELLSPSTAHADLTTKKDIYEQIFRTPEYYCYDPNARMIQGRRLDPLIYRPISANEKGWLWSEELKLWLGCWEGSYSKRQGTWLRFYTKEEVLVPTSEEDAARRAAAAAEIATAAEQLSAAAEQKAASAQQQADELRRRAETAEAELARLKAQQK